MESLGIDEGFMLAEMLEREFADAPAAFKKRNLAFPPGDHDLGEDAPR